MSGASMQVPILDAISKKITRICLIIIFLAISALALVVHSEYPVVLTQTGGYVSQLPPSLLVVAVTLLLCSCLLAFTGDSIAVAAFATVIVFYTLNISDLFFYSISGGDMTGIIDHLQLLNQHHFFEYNNPFTYLQWPNLFTLVVMSSRIIGIDIVATSSLTYYALYTLLALAVLLFSYSTVKHTAAGSPLTTFAVAVSFIVLALPWLNNQLTPQFLGLILLFTLFSLYGKTGFRWGFLKVLLFIGLVLTHPFLFAFYILALVLHPIVLFMRESLVERFGDARVYEITSNPKSVLSSTSDSLRMTVRSLPNWAGFVVVLISIYMFFFILRFKVFRRLLVPTLLGSVSDVGAATMNPILQLIGYRLGTAQGADELTNQTFLFYLESEMLHTITYQVSRVGLALVLFFLLSLYLIERIRTLPSFGIAILTASTFYFLSGTVFNILGARALQVLLLPVGLGLIAISHREKMLVVLILVFVLIGAVVPVYSMVNASVEGGGSIQDYHANQAGKDTYEYRADGQNVIKPQYTIHPYTHEEGVIALEQLVKDSENTSSGDLLISTPRTSHLLTYYSYYCTYEKGGSNVIYQNRGGQVLYTQDATIDCGG